jgi:hypothetical protein
LDSMLVLALVLGLGLVLVLGPGLGQVVRVRLPGLAGAVEGGGVKRTWRTCRHSRVCW